MATLALAIVRPRSPLRSAGFALQPIAIATPSAPKIQDLLIIVVFRCSTTAA